jgi:multidrug transporter EmrE-like cation transporter
MSESDQVGPNKPGEKKKSPALALALAFLPSVIFLTMLSTLQHQSQPPAALFVLCCVISVVCCLVSAFLLFRRKTGWAIFGGILFMLLNAVVSFLFGCGAILTQMKF